MQATGLWDSSTESKSLQQHFFPCWKIWAVGGLTQNRKNHLDTVNSWKTSKRNVKKLLVRGKSSVDSLRISIRFLFNLNLMFLFAQHADTCWLLTVRGSWDGCRRVWEQTSLQKDQGRHTINNLARTHCIQTGRYSTQHNTQLGLTTVTDHYRHVAGFCQKL